MICKCTRVGQTHDGVDKHLLPEEVTPKSDLKPEDLRVGNVRHDASSMLNSAAAISMSSSS